MKLKSILVVLTLAIISTTSIFAQKVQLKTPQDSLSYVIGLQFAKSLKMDSLMLNLDLVKQGMNDLLYKDNPQLSDQEVARVMDDLQNKLKERQKIEEQKLMAERLIKAEENLEKGKKFLAENKEKPGVKVTPTGLQYKVLKEGEGPSPSDADKVRVHYRGTLIDGTTFDSSIERGKPIDFGVGQVIKGWTEALKMMKKGSKWMIYIPAELAYGERGAQQVIGPNETLIFEVELLDINPETPIGQ